MEGIVGWFIYFGLQFFELCNCYPVTPLADGSPPGLELGSLLPSFLATATIITILLLLAGCTWCTRIFKKDVGIGQPIQLGETGSCEVVDPGILNPLNDIRFPITSPISHHSLSPRNQQQRSNHPDDNALPLHVPFYTPEQHNVDNNNVVEDNNNGPISPQELENIVNNNAENYIVTQYENRNLNPDGHREELQEVAIASTSSSVHTSPRRNVWTEYSDWFYNSDEDFPRAQLQYLQVIGKGWFGRIVEGEAHGLHQDKSSSPRHRSVTRVAVKILDENISVADKCTFLNESQTLKDATHENILKFLGKNLSQDPWFILLEYCSLGDLKNYLLNNKCQVETLNKQGYPLKFILEVSSALNYLHHKNIDHCLACHSCLVTEGLSLRLGDYGDAEQRYPEHFYSTAESNPLPVRWLPPESISMPQGSASENIWSLGIFIWECCSWGALPYENLSNEQVIKNVLCLNGQRLPEPVPITQYTCYLYNVMQTCWNDDPAMRCHASQVYEYMQSLYAKFYNPTSHMDDSFADNFNARWETLKPNNIPKIDNSLPQSSPQPENNYCNLNFTQSDVAEEPHVRIIHPRGELAYQNLAISTDTISIEEITLKVKSDSLTNLHGSFESVSMRENTTNLNENFSSNKNENAQDEKSFQVLVDVMVEKSLLENSVPDVAPWLLDVPFKTPEDISYIKNVSDVISDFDNMLSSEKTSSSESSPSRDVVTHTSGATCDHGSSQIILSEEDDKISLNDSVAEINTCFKECQPQESAYETDVGSESVNNSVTRVPEISKLNVKDIYPTLDFRLTNTVEEESSMHPIFGNMTGISNTIEPDSLQDSSYTLSANKDTSSYKRSTSGSETEDEVWKKRVEMGLITEKIKMKSKSITDLMVLTHIDMDFTDMDSENASYNSLEENSHNFLNIIHRRLKRKSSQQETGLPSEQYLSFPNNFSPSVFSQLVNCGKLWKNCKGVTMKSLRPSKSLSELNVFSQKVTPYEDLLNFKRKMDSFLGCSSNGKIKQYSNTDVKLNHSETRHFNLAGPSVFPHQTFVNNYSVNSYLNVDGEEENLKFSSNFNDINLNIYADETTVLPLNKSDPWESTEYISLPERFSLEEEPNSQLVDSIKMEMFDSKNITQLPNSSFALEELSEKDVKTSTPNLSKDANNKQLVIPSVSVSDASDDNLDRNEICINSLVERQIDEIIRSEMLNITTKLAIAENENNLNIELYTPPNTIEESDDDYGESRPIVQHSEISEASNVNVTIRQNCVQSGKQDESDHDNVHNTETTSDDHILSAKETLNLSMDSSKIGIYNDDVNVDTETDVCKVETINEIICGKDRTLSNELIQDLDSELEKLDAACEVAEANYFSPETSESLYENVDPRYKSQGQGTSSSGWYLHPKDNFEELVPELNAFPINLPSSNGSSVESLTENTTSDRYTVDPESVEALRNELQLKLPLAQRMTQIHHDNLASNVVNDASDLPNSKTPLSLPMCKPSVRDTNAPLYSAIEASTSMGSSCDIGVPGYTQGNSTTYGNVPLSPIQEESWSEFSEMEKAADMDKTDASNSLSPGEQTSNIEQILPFDGVCDMTVVGTGQCSNQQDSCKQMTQDDDTHSDCSNRTFVLNEGGPINLRRQQSLSADSLNSIEQFDVDDEVDCERKPNSINMDVPQVVIHPSVEMFSSYCDEHSHPKSTEEISQNVDNLLETISKTLENASKIGTCCDHIMLPNGNECDVSENDDSGSKTYIIEDKIDAVQDLNAVYNDKVAGIPDDVSNVSKVSQPSFVSDVTSPVSDKSLSVHSHTKTLSMDSWCSNDTLFNVEENFDDAYIGDIVSPPYRMETFKDSPVYPMEVVMGCSENVNNLSLHEDNGILSVFQQIDKSPPEKLEVMSHLPILLGEPAVEMEINIVNSDVPVVSMDRHNLSNAIENESVAEEEVTDITRKLFPETSSDHVNISNLSNVGNNVYKSNFELRKMNMTSTPTTSMNNEMNVENSTDCEIDNHFKFLESLSDGQTSDSKDGSSLLRATDSFLQNEQKFAHSLADRSNSCLKTLNHIPIPVEGNCTFSASALSLSQSATNVSDNSNMKKGSVEDVQKSVGCIHEGNSKMSQVQHFVGARQPSLPDDSNISQLSSTTETQNEHQSNSLNNVGEPDNSEVAILHSTDVNIASSPDLSAVINDNSAVDSALPNINTTEISTWNPVTHLDLTNPLLIEYMESTGLNMGLQNLEETKSKEDSPSFEAFKQTAGTLPQDLAHCTENEYKFNTLQDLYSPGLRNIQFSGPWKEDVMSTSFSETSPVNETGVETPGQVFPVHEEIGHIAPERLKDWESESDDSNCSSTSSGDFVWKEGDGAQLLNVPSFCYPSSGMMKQQVSRGASQSFADIPEEAEDAKSDQQDGEEEEEDEEEVDFVPSSWDCHAAPSKSALKSPDTSQIETRKRVAFKKQKYQSIYEYPRDDETFQTLPEFSTYAEWTATNSGDYMPADYQQYMSEAPPLSCVGGEDDFFISSSTRPFESYSTMNSSQFFPGLQFSLLTNHHTYGESLDDDFDSLPPIPTEQELQQALGDDANMEHTDNSNKKACDYITPDSGTEDTSPGDLDFEDILNKKNLAAPPQSANIVDEGVDNDVDNTVSIENTAHNDKLILPPTTVSGTTALLGGLRHTRDKLKLDLPPSPLPRNSPCLINSGKSSNKEVRIFDFKSLESDESDIPVEVIKHSPSKSESVKYTKELDDDSKKDMEKCLSSLESDTCDSDVISPNSVISVIGKFSAINNEHKSTVNAPETASSPPVEGDVAILQKSVIRMQDKARRVSLEAVKGEGTLLDSGDEDSGIGSSAYATLERKCDDVQSHPAVIKNSNKPA